jgi:hypothetical protein
MRILRTTVIGVAAIGAAGWLSSSLIAREQAARSMPAQQTPMGKGMPMGKDAMPMTGKDMPMGAAKMTKAQKIANAMTAAPSVVSAKATILDWPEKEGMAPPALRAGTNGWTCMPDMPDSKGNDPACMDKPWMMWVDAYLAHKPPQLSSVGIAYMTAPGGGESSNTDPFATGPTPTNGWHHHPPHVMIVVPNVKELEGMSTDPMNGGPYVMYAGTPYAHIMAPLAAPMAMPMKK